MYTGEGRDMTSGASGWRVKYAGPCTTCGTELRRGDVAVWDRVARKMHCVECPAPGEAVPVEVPIDGGMGGRSARAKHERLVARRDEATRARWGNRLGRVVLALTNEPQSTRAWRIGAEGEEHLARALADIDGVWVLNDRAIRDSRANIDHIVVAPAGVFVVDAKNYKGKVEIRDRGGFFRTDLRLYVGGRNRSHDAEGLRRQVEAVEYALLNVGVHPMPSVTPVLCFVRADWPLLWPPDSYDGVRLESPKSLLKLLKGQSELDAQRVETLARTLATALPPK
jgi:hypothetical protein